MGTLILVLLVIGFIVSLIKIDFDCAITIITFVGVFIFAIVFLGNLAILTDVSNNDEQIALYEKENVKIEKTIENYVISEDVDYEKDTYFVNQQSKLYKENQKEIMELKAETLDAASARFWIYFGK